MASPDEDILARIKRGAVPRHLAVIMDGNGRWARQKGAERVFGHRNAIKAVRDVTEGAAEVGVGFLTLYAFSTENWNRPAAEVAALMQLLVSTIRKETPTLMENNVRLRSIGDRATLPRNCVRELDEAIEMTQGNTGMELILALSYSGRSEIMAAVNRMLDDYRANGLPEGPVAESDLARYMMTANVPDPELLIRTSGEMRISNFLLWQIAYSELYFTDVLWPDFRREHLYEALLAFQSRERRFGKTSEQVRKVIEGGA